MASTLFNDVLSRCDTIHDFTGERARKATDTPFYPYEVYKILDNIDRLNTRVLLDRFDKMYGHRMDVGLASEFKAILTRNENINFGFIKGNEDYIGTTRTGGYEPAVVLFFEYMLGSESLVEPVYMLTFDAIREHNFVDFTTTIDKAFSPRGRVSIFNIGNVAKDGKRCASGVWKSDAVMEEFKQNLKRCFCEDPNNTTIKFVIDASSVGNENFHTPDDNMVVVSIASTLWDSASKYADAVQESSTCKVSATDPDTVLYVLDSIVLEKVSKDLLPALNGRIVQDYDRIIPREVPSIVECIQTRCYQADVFGDLDDPGVMFDIKRSGDGCQVLEIKALNARARSNEKYVLVTLDHLAFLKARMNGVPVVFTQKHAPTDTKRLVCVNNEDNISDAERLELLIRAARAEESALATFCGSWNEDARHSVYTSFNALINWFGVVKNKLTAIFFGGHEDPDARDRHFDQLVLSAIARDRVYMDLNKSQQADLRYMSMRIKAYLFDFLCIELDLEARYDMIDSIYVVCESLLDALGETLHSGSKALKRGGGLKRMRDDIDACTELQRVLTSCALVKKKLYGASLYAWVFDDNICGALSLYCDDLLRYLEELSPKSPLEKLQFIHKKHFLLEGQQHVQTVLNFKPLKVYEHIWNFLRKSYTNISLSIAQPRATRGSTSTSQMFIEKSKAFVESKYGAALMDNRPPNPAWKEIVEQVLEYDELLKNLIMEENVQNFSFRMCNAGFVAEWLAFHSIQLDITRTPKGGGGYEVVNNDDIESNASQDDIVQYYDDNNADIHETSSYRMPLHEHNKAVLAACRAMSRNMIRDPSLFPPFVQITPNYSSSINLQDCSLAGPKMDDEDENKIAEIEAIMYDAFISRFYELELEKGCFMTSEGYITIERDMFSMLYSEGCPNWERDHIGGDAERSGAVARVVTCCRELVRNRGMTWAGVLMLVSGRVVPRCQASSEGAALHLLLSTLRAMKSRDLVALEEKLGEK